MKAYIYEEVVGFTFDRDLCAFRALYATYLVPADSWTNYCSAQKLYERYLVATDDHDSDDEPFNYLGTRPTCDIVEVDDVVLAALEQGDGEAGDLDTLVELSFGRDSVGPTMETLCR